MKEIEAIKIVRRLLLSKICFVNHFYSGDKDTYIQACVEILNEHNLDYDDCSGEEFNTYHKDIMSRYDELVIKGRKEMNFLQEVNNLLLELLEEEKLNLKDEKL